MKRCLVNDSALLETSSNFFSVLGVGAIQRFLTVNSLLTLALLIGCLVFQGCGGGSSQGGNNPPPPPPPPPASPSVSIVSPANNANVTVLPVTLHLSIANTTTSTPFRALLDGVDITSQFGTVANGDVQITVTKPAINFGFNQLQVTLGTQRVSTQFNYNPNALPGAQASPATLGQLVPIQTRVLKPNGNPTVTSDWGIELGSESVKTAQYYWADTTSNCTGACFQVVLLKRTDLSLVSNKVYETGDAQGIANFGSVIAPSQAMISSCGNPGCLEIIQSIGQVGPTECGSAGSSQDPNCQCPEHVGGLWGGSYAGPNFVPDCSLANQQANNMTIGGTYGSYFTQIGASSTIAFAANNSNVAYSYIGNIGNGANPFASTPINTYSPGVFSERLTCSDSGSSCGNFPNGIDISGSAPEGDPTQNGNISGALVLDNNNAYTFTQVAAPVTFTMAVAPDSTPTNPKNLLTISTSTPTADESADNLPITTGRDGKNHQGGFHMSVYDATTFQPYMNATYTILYSNPNTLPAHVENLSQMPSDLDKFTSRRFVVFIASIGDLYHDGPYGNTGLSGEDVWDQVAQRIVRLGGTYVTFEMLDNVNFSKPNNGNSSGNDDYALVGRPWIIESDVAQPYAAEESSQISRQTSVSPVASNMQGVLKMDREGYYAPSVHSNYEGFVPDVVTTMASASYQSPIYWPLDGPNDTPESISAYQWVSQELCCDDIRTAYVNLNAAPDAWLAQMQTLTYDPAKYADTLPQQGFDGPNLTTVEAQLTLEFKYLSAVRQFQSNVTSLYADQQANVGLILQQAQDAVEGAIPIPPDSSSSSASWTGILNDVFNVMGPVGGLLPLADPETEGISGGLYVALGVGSTLLDVASDEANDASGNPLAQQEAIETTASNLAQKAADEYAQNLIALGAQFDRVASDWGRLKTVGSPLSNNLVPWDARATGILLQSFDLSSRREYFARLLAANYYIDQIVYASPDANYNDAYFQGCDWWGVMNDADDANQEGAYGFFPGARIDGPLSTPHTGDNLYPQGNWWDVWFFGQQGNSADCPSTSRLAPAGAFGLFDPVSPSNPASLGIYKPWFYLRSGLPLHQENKTRYGNYGENGDPPMY
jgi:hypothetical protein